MNAQESVNYQTTGGIAVIEFFSARGNSMPGTLLRRLAAEIRRAHADESVRVIQLRSSGTGPFCAGASFDELISIKSLEAGREFFLGFAEVMLAMIRGPRPVVSRIQGKAVGGGVGLAAAADYAVAGAGAAVRLSELAIGIGPFTIGPVVERKVGPAAFSELALSADWRDSNWAQSRGLYQNVLPSIADLDQEIQNFCLKLAGCSAAALAKLKQVIWSGTERWEDLLKERAHISAELLLTSEAQAQLQAIHKKS